MFNKIILKIITVSIISSSLVLNTYADSMGDLFSLFDETFESNIEETYENDDDYDNLDSNTEYESDEISCSKGVPNNSTTYQDEYFDCDITIGVNFDAMNDSNIEVTGNLVIESNADIEGDLIVQGDLYIEKDLRIGGNLIVTGDISGENSNIDVAGYTRGNNIVIGANLYTQAIVATGYVSLGNNSTVTRGIVTDGYLMTGNNFDVEGISIIRGEFVTGDNFDGSGTMYIYGDLTGKSNFDFDGTKLKVTTDFEIESNATIEGRIFIYGSKEKGSNYDEYKKNYGYLIGEIDPFLQYNLTKDEFNTIRITTIAADKRVYYYKISAKEMSDYIYLLIEKNINNSNDTIIAQKTEELNRLKDSTIYEYTKLFAYLDDFIENEAFDVNGYNELKEERLTDLNTYLNSLAGSNNSVNIDEISITKIEKTKPKVEKPEIEDEIAPEELEEVYNEIGDINKQIGENEKKGLSQSLITKLDTALSEIDDNFKESTYKRIIENIEELLEEDDEDLSIDRETLILIKEYLEKELEEINIIDKIFG